MFALEPRPGDAAGDRPLGLRRAAARRASGRCRCPSRRRPATAARERRTVAVARRTSSSAAIPELAAACPAQARCAPSRCSRATRCWARVGVSRQRARVRRRRARAAGGARPPGRAGARARAAVSTALHTPAGTTTAALARALTPQEVAATAAAQGAEALGRRAARGWRCSTRAGARSSSRTPPGHEPRPRAALRLAARSTPSCRSPQAARTVDAALAGERRRRSSAPTRASREVRPQAQAAALLPLVRRRARRSARSGSSSTTRTVFRPHDRDYLLALTRLCGQALGRARRYQAEHDLAATLQHALLPESLPRADGLELAVRYLPAADGDGRGRRLLRRASSCRGGRLGIAVGDVVGHGPEAAAAMGQLRSALRAYALEGRPPARVLQLLSRYADGVAGARGATLVYAVARPGRARAALRLAPGIRRRCWSTADGEHALPGGRARRAAGPRARATSTRTRSPRCRSASTLVLYSDGAIERRGEPLDVGHGAARARRPRRRARLEPDALCTRAAGRAVRRRRATGATTSRCWSARALPLAVTPLHLWFAARPDQLAVVREAMRTWLAGAGVEPGDARARRAGRGRAVRELGRARLPARAATPRSRSRWRASRAAC